MKLMNGTERHWPFLSDIEQGSRGQCQGIFQNKIIVKIYN